MKKNYVPFYYIFSRHETLFAEVMRKSSQCSFRTARKN